MDRISTLAASGTLIGSLGKAQARLHALQTQVATEQRAQTYAGVAGDASAIIGLETRQQMLAQFRRSGEMLGTRLAAAAAGIDDLRQTAADFRQALVGIGGVPLDAARVTGIQEAAFRSLKSMEATLASDFNGRALFAGSRTTGQPMVLGAATLGEFQATWDGSRVVYPPTRDAHVGSRASLPPAVTGGLTFAAGPPGTLGAAHPVFANIPLGATIEISGSGSHDGAYTVVDRTPDTLTLSGDLSTPGSASFNVTRPIVAGAEPAATLSVRSWYTGDASGAAETVRIDETRMLDLALPAIDPGIEKAIRAMGIVAQGGLAAAPERLADALALLNDALDQGAGNVSPYGNERPGTIDALAAEIGFNQALLKETGERHAATLARLADRTAALQGIDKTEAIARLLDQSNALEASYQAVARIRQLNLAKFLT